MAYRQNYIRTAPPNAMTLCNILTAKQLQSVNGRMSTKSAEIEFKAAINRPFHGEKPCFAARKTAFSGTKHRLLLH